MGGVQVSALSKNRNVTPKCAFENRQNAIRNQCEGIVKIRYPLVILFSSMLFKKKAVLGYFQVPSVIAGGYPTKNMETPKDQNLGRCQNFHQLSPQHIYDAAQVAGPELGAWRRLATPCTMASPGSSTTEFWDKNGLFLKMSVSLRPGTPQPPCRKSLPIHKSKKKSTKVSLTRWHTPGL